MTFAVMLYIYSYSETLVLYFENIKKMKLSVCVYIYICIYIYITIEQHTAAAAAVAAAAPRPARSDARRAGRAGAPPTGLVGTPLLLPLLLPLYIVQWFYLYIYYVVAKKIHLSFENIIFWEEIVALMIRFFIFKYDFSQENKLFASKIFFHLNIYFYQDNYEIAS